MRPSSPLKLAILKKYGKQSDFVYSVHGKLPLLGENRLTQVLTGRLRITPEEEKVFQEEFGKRAMSEHNKHWYWKNRA
jgi:hypothetical protein